MPVITDKIPITLDEAIAQICDQLDDNEKSFIVVKGLTSTHHSFGMMLRNDWGLWKKDNPIAKEVSQKFGLWGHADDLSGLIMSGVTARIRDESVEMILENTATKYKNHWIKSGIDPQTGISNKQSHRFTVNVTKNGGTIEVE